MTVAPTSWACAQLGSREHYGGLRAFQASGRLRLMLVDAWVKPTNPIRLFNRRLRDRYRPELRDVDCGSFTASLCAFEIRARWKGLKGWSLMIARNHWFQDQT